MSELRIKRFFRRPISALFCLSIFIFIGFTANFSGSEAVAADSVNLTGTSESAAKKELPIVYMTTKITPEGLISVYNAMGRKLPGKVGVKISTGEPGGHNFLAPALIKNLVQSLNGTIVECNTAYGGKRSTTKSHKQAAKDHGFTAIAPVDILDEDGSISLPFSAGKNIKEDLVGSHFLKYYSFLVLSHFKGHQMGGFGGALKNMSIGFASADGKMWIHSAGAVRKTGDFSPALKTNQNAFLESMAEAAGAIMNKMGNRIAYVNVMNNLSIDCDCNGNPAPPEMADIGILASLDPVALDQACVDLVYASPDKKKSAALCKRMEKQNAVYILEHAEALGLGSRKYKLVMIDEPEKSAIFPIGKKLESKNFNGTVWLNMLTPAGSPCPIANVTFEPGCRNNWHKHMGGQNLLITGGRGYYQEWGKPARELNPGDVVQIPANVKHWHGAAKDSWFSHLAIEINPEKGPAKWLEPVSDEDYNKLK